MKIGLGVMMMILGCVVGCAGQTEGDESSEAAQADEAQKVAFDDEATNASPTAAKKCTRPSNHLCSRAFSFCPDPSRQTGYWCNVAEQCAACPYIP